jgi:restriction system protein
MIGAPIGTAIGAAFPLWSDRIAEGGKKVNLVISQLIIPEKRTADGFLIKSTSLLWHEIVRKLGNDWSIAFQISPDKWEELVAGAFKEAGYDEVTITPCSGDHGRDVIAIKNGIGCVKILGSVKAYAPHNLVSYDSVRSLMGVVSSDRNASKGIISTTSDFPPNIEDDPLIAPLIPTRLELMNGTKLQNWLRELSK